MASETRIAAYLLLGENRPWRRAHLASDATCLRSRAARSRACAGRRGHANSRALGKQKPNYRIKSAGVLDGPPVHSQSESQFLRRGRRLTGPFGGTPSEGSTHDQYL
jgi:hypothetical protein